MCFLPQVSPPDLALVLMETLILGNFTYFPRLRADSVWSINSVFIQLPKDLKLVFNKGNEEFFPIVDRSA